MNCSTSFLLVLLIFNFLSEATESKKSSSKAKRKLVPYDTSLYLNICVATHPTSSTRHYKADKNHHRALQWLLQTSGERSIIGESTHQHRAACWMLYGNPPRSAKTKTSTTTTTISTKDQAAMDKKLVVKASSQQFAQRYALAVLYYATQGDDKWEIKTDWMSGKHECSWYGVVCGDTPLDRHTVVGLDLGFNQLNGLLPRELALLQNIIEVDFHGNDLQGIIPMVSCLHGRSAKS
ncbi:Leucine Rich Repeat [Fragilaria crotonensis]|nr:Leucine Rich Repeat [Fragilaria crotonensis]